MGDQLLNLGRGDTGCARGGIRREAVLEVAVTAGETDDGPEPAIEQDLQDDQRWVLLHDPRRRMCVGGTRHPDQAQHVKEITESGDGFWVIITNHSGSRCLAHGRWLKQIRSREGTTDHGYAAGHEGGSDRSMIVTVVIRHLITTVGPERVA